MGMSFFDKAPVTGRQEDHSRVSFVGDSAEVRLDEIGKYRSTNEYLHSKLGLRLNKPALDLTEVSRVANSVVSAPLLKLQMHEQIGRRYLFEFKLNQLLAAGINVDAVAAKEFLVGLLAHGKFDSLPVEIRTKAIQLSEVQSVQREFANEKVSIFNPKPRGLDLNLGYRPS